MHTTKQSGDTDQRTNDADRKSAQNSKKKSDAHIFYMTKSYSDSNGSHLRFTARITSSTTQIYIVIRKQRYTSMYHRDTWREHSKQLTTW